MGKTKKVPEVLPVKIYKRVSGVKNTKNTDADYLLKFRVYLKDRPGTLASFSSLIARCGANICFFHYDRSLDSSRVVVEVRITSRASLDIFLHALEKGRYSFEKESRMKEEVQITSPENILEIKVGLVNKIGSLAAFARLLKDHRANVIYMFYDEDIDPESADIALATESAGEIDNLLEAVNHKGYHYRVVYRGADSEEVEHIIGLKMVEKFFMRLRKLLSGSDLEEVKALVDSSQELQADLVSFYSEAGNNMEAADVFEKVLTLASMSRSRTGNRFSAGEMPPLSLGTKITLFGFRLPTSENIYVFSHDNEITLIDTGYGLYYEDVKALLRSKSLDPAAVKRIFITHADADHAGMAGFFAREFGTKVFTHPDSRKVIDNKNRAYGVSGRLLDLNRYYTRLINIFTDYNFPDRAGYFSTAVIGKEGSFDVTDTFMIADLKFLVLTSHGGHIPGQVFFLNKDLGLLFTSDYLINSKSLSDEEKGNLGIYRYLLTNPNSDSGIFKGEMAGLKDIIRSIDGELRLHGKFALIFPGHGEYYRPD